MGKLSSNPGLEDLEIYCLAEEISDLVWSEVDRWEPFPKETLGKQVVRAADSIGGNIAEGYGRYHFRDRLNFLYYARGSLFETDTRWRKAYRRSLLGTDAFENVVEKVQVLSPKLNGYIRRTREEIGLGQTKAPPRLAEPEANYSVLAGAEEDPQIG